MPESFDPYHRWLGIPPKHQPPNHYRLLGLEPFESDPEVIRDAAERQMRHVRDYQIGPNSELSQQILNELAAAKTCLFDAAKRARYDESLRDRLGRPEAALVPPPMMPQEVTSSGTASAAPLPARPTSKMPVLLGSIVGGSLLLGSVLAITIVLTWRDKPVAQADRDAERAATPSDATPPAAAPKAEPKLAATPPPVQPAPVDPDSQRLDIAGPAPGESSSGPERAAGIRRRGEATTFAVEDLRATAGRGPLQRAAAGEGPRGVAVGAAAKGYRWVALIGAVPLKKQTDAFKKAYENCLVPKPENSIPHYRLWYIERAEVAGRGATDNLKWEPVDFAAARKKAQDVLGKGLADPLDAAILDQRFVDREAVFDLPSRGDRQSWEPKIVRHPRIVGPAFEDVRTDPKSFEGQKVTWQGEVLFSTANESRVEAARAVYSIHKVSEYGKPSAVIDNECFAVDYATAEAARAAGRGVVTAIVKGKVTVNILVTTERGSGTRPATMPLLQDAGGGEKTDEMPDYQLFRFLDFDVQPGKLYRYRVQSLLKNPNYGVEIQALEKPELGEKPWIRTGWSEPSDMVAVPVDTRLLAGPVTPPTRIIGEPQGRIKIKKWVEANGIEASQEFTCFRGAVADYPNCTWPEGRTPPKPGKKDNLPAARGARAAANRITPFRVDFLTGDILLDMRGERIARSLTERAGSGELLILDTDGNLRVYNELEGQQDYEDHEEEPADDERMPPTFDRTDGGLPFETRR